MSRICTNMGDPGKLRFYELDHESKMRLLKTHSHTSNEWSVYGARNTRRKAVEGNADPTTRQTSPIKNLPRAAGRCGGGGQKGSRTCRIPPVWRGGQERLYGKPIAEKVLWRGEPSSIWRGTQALTQGRSHAKKKNPTGHRHGGGLDEETTNTRDGRWQHLQRR